MIKHTLVHHMAMCIICIYWQKGSTILCVYSPLDSTYNCLPGRVKHTPMWSKLLQPSCYVYTAKLLSMQLFAGFINGHGSWKKLHCCRFTDHYILITHVGQDWNSLGISPSFKFFYFPNKKSLLFPIEHLRFYKMRPAKLPQWQCNNRKEQ